MTIGGTERAERASRWSEVITIVFRSCLCLLWLLSYCYHAAILLLSCYNHAFIILTKAIIIMRLLCSHSYLGLRMHNLCDKKWQGRKYRLNAIIKPEWQGMWPHDRPIYNPVLLDLLHGFNRPRKVTRQRLSLERILALPSNRSLLRTRKYFYCPLSGTLHGL